MRRDMDKVIVERPRIGRNRKNDQKGEGKRWQKSIINEDFGAKRESTARRRRTDHKELNEHLGPLKRFLRTRVGQHWDKVYSEIRSCIDPKSAVQMHILQHLEWYVEVNTKQWEDGEITDTKGQTIYDEYFVHPVTKVLTKNPKYGTRWAKYKKPEPKFIKMNDRSFMEIKGVWYEIGLKPMPPRSDKKRPYYLYSYPDPMVFDEVFRGNTTYDQAMSFYGGHYYATMKRQLNSKEIHQMGLKHSQAA